MGQRKLPEGEKRERREKGEKQNSQDLSVFGDFRGESCEAWNGVKEGERDVRMEMKER